MNSQNVTPQAFSYLKEQLTARMSSNDSDSCVGTGGHDGDSY